MDGTSKIITCGCRFNRYESAEISKELQSASGRQIVMINSCAVTAKSEAKSRHAVRRAVRENPGASIVVGGCWAELDPSAVRAIEGVHLVLGNEEKFRPADFIGGGEKVRVGSVNNATEFIETEPYRLADRTSAYLKIQNGCDETCSFCVVRLVRGQSRSARPEFVLKRIEKLVDEGAKEIVFTGINLGQYGQDLSAEPSLAEILKTAAGHHRRVRFRLSSVNPNDITDELIGVMADNENICRFLHVPLQSGSDEILRAMRRPYSSAEYRAQIERVSARLPGLGLGCDIMAGFPGETDEDFSSSLRLLKELPFTYAHVFGYSPRKPTDAFRMAGALPSAVKKERVEKLKSVSAEKNLLFRESLIGKTVEILVEHRQGDNGFLRGKTAEFINAEFEGNEKLCGKLVKIRVEQVTNGGVMGVMM